MASNALAITADGLRDLLAYDRATGEFRWRESRHNTNRAGDKAGSPTRFGYVSIVVNRRRYYAHRLAWLHVYGEWPSACIDHIDGNKANNALSNLRDVAHQLNMQNVNRPSTNNTSGYRGVSRKRDKWRASISAGGQQISLGSFKTAEEARDAYADAKRKFHKEAIA